MIQAGDMSAAELAALLSFHADAGVEWLLEDVSVDRVAEFAAEKQARGQRQPSRRETSPAQASPGPAAAEKAVSRPLPSTPVAIPDDKAIADARFAAESARTLDELKLALEGFTSCNLKVSARSTIFAQGNPASGLMIVGPMPSSDDDREGVPFSGRAGALLDRMLAAAGLTRQDALLTTAIAWRPPGDRPPSPAEAAICRPFIERQIVLTEPKSLLLLGNFTARFFFGANATIHALRGQWRDVAAGSHVVPALATFHPQELLLAPATKALAWQDLLTFRAGESATGNC
ncbi:uracil-DNA glycosylase [Allorhizobium undicola]|uniref:uracil-DNA glycosylase n=1 Tax=Allorhizobium undicola TaxID=78527 RepID=UPI0004815903|nr:uracil-DNA glycosylase [Allorhizobium undicola]